MMERLNIEKADGGAGITIGKVRGQFHQHVYAKLLCMQIPKVQKRQSSHECLFALMGSLLQKAVRKTT